MKRSYAPEVMDDLTLGGAEMEQTLKELDFINRWLGGNQLSVQGLHALWPRERDSLSLLDLGTGSGDLILQMQASARLKDRRLLATGLDANPHIVEMARRHCADQPDIRHTVGDVLDPAFRHQQADIVHASLFLHHFNETELIDILTAAHEIADVGLIINDLHRHPLAFQSIRILTRLFSKSPMVQHDAPLSVARGFRRQELIRVLKAAGWTRFRLRWGWAFRWQVVAWKA